MKRPNLREDGIEEVQEKVVNDDGTVTYEIIEYEWVTENGKRVKKKRGKKKSSGKVFMMENVKDSMWK